MPASTITQSTWWKIRVKCCGKVSNLHFLLKLTCVFRRQHGMYINWLSIMEIEPATTSERLGTAGLKVCHPSEASSRRCRRMLQRLQQRYWDWNTSMAAWHVSVARTGDWSDTKSQTRLARLCQEYIAKERNLDEFLCAVLTQDTKLDSSTLVWRKSVVCCIDEFILCHMVRCGVLHVELMYFQYIQ